MKAKVKIKGTGQPAWTLMKDVIQPSLDQHETWIDEVDADAQSLHKTDEIIKSEIDELKTGFAEFAKITSFEFIELDKRLKEDIRFHHDTLKKSHEALLMELIETRGRVKILEQRSRRPWIVNFILDLYEKYAHRKTARA